MIDTFADATHDHQWIHVDRDRAATGPFGTTIAHGYLTLSLLPVLVGGMVEVPDAAMTVNYGLDRLRLTSPVPAGARIRAHAVVRSSEPKGGGTLSHTDVRIEIEGEERPALVADVLSLRFAGA
ncbi:MAG: MaoC family dehydratase [Nitriliruptoraceae bacterium]|nr:MaoC family dehydratase [Nitriliruptoraceae bacterium]